MNPSKFPSSVSPYSVEADILDFHTEASWSAYDLATALNSMDTVYSTFILARHLAVLANHRLREMVEDHPGPPSRNMVQFPVKPKASSSSPAQRSVQAGTQKAISYQFNNERKK